MAQVERWLQIGPGLPFHVGLDTGMARAGIDWREFGAVAARFRDEPAFEGVFTHFHSADADLATRFRPPHALSATGAAVLARLRREGYDWLREPTPLLTVTGKRLDAPAPPLVASQASNGFQDQVKSFMVVGVNVPTEGCWEITGRTGDQELRFVVWVTPN